MRQFTLNDYKHLDQWFTKRGIRTPSPLYLPPTGIIEDGVAAGFLINTDCSIGILDYFITNPDVEKSARADALEGITDMLILSAKRAGLKALKCDTKFKNIEGLAIKKNFSCLGDTLAFFKEL